METTLENVKPFAIDVKGGGKASKRRKVEEDNTLLRMRRGRKLWRKY